MQRERSCSSKPYSCHCIPEQVRTIEMRNLTELARWGEKNNKKIKLNETQNFLCGQLLFCLLKANWKTAIQVYSWVISLTTKVEEVMFVYLSVSRHYRKTPHSFQLSFHWVCFLLQPTIDILLAKGWRSVTERSNISQRRINGST